MHFYEGTPTLTFATLKRVFQCLGPGPKVLHVGPSQFSKKKPVSPTIDFDLDLPIDVLMLLAFFIQGRRGLFDGA